MDSLGHFRGQGLTLKDKFQGQQISVGYRGHIYLLKVSVDENETMRFNFILMEKKPQNV